MRPTLEALGETMAALTDALEWVDEAQMRALFPPLRTGGEHIVAGIVHREGLRLDSDALLQHYARIIRAAGGAVLTERRVAAIEPAMDGDDRKRRSVRGTDPDQRGRRLGRSDRDRSPAFRRSGSSRCAGRSSSSILRRAWTRAAGRS